MPRVHRSWLIAVVIAAIAARAGMIAWRNGELTQDRDAYLGLAAGVAEGRGFSSPGSTTPTAYRPPLYPLLLAAGPQSQMAAWVGLLNILSGMGTVGLTFALARRLGLHERVGLATASLVAIDPLLVRYASQPMTESVCALLVTAWLWQIVRLQQEPSRGAAFSTGVLFGLAALCRPTLWAAGGLVAGWWLWRMRASRMVNSAVPVRGFAIGSTAVAGCLLVVLPWVFRNQLQMGQSILTTTHGGYTLLLGNNEVFYRDVVRQPWGTDWDGSRGPSQSEWITRELRSMEADGVRGEVAADQWMRQRAVTHIQHDPKGFLAACGLRQLWFWSPIPLGDARRGWPDPILWGVGVFYVMLWIGCLAGLIDVWMGRAAPWAPGLLVVLGFAGAHLVYWSNARMRAPVAAVLALLAVQGWLAIGQWQRAFFAHSRAAARA